MKTFSYFNGNLYIVLKNIEKSYLEKCKDERVSETNKNI